VLACDGATRPPESSAQATTTAAILNARHAEPCILSSSRVIDYARTCRLIDAVISVESYDFANAAVTVLRAPHCRAECARDRWTSTASRSKAV
jgi:hypothetical protein